MTTAELEGLLFAGKYVALKQKLDGSDAGELPPLDRLRLGAALVVQGLAPLSDLVLAARKHAAEKSAHATLLVGDALAALERAGLGAMARRLADETGGIASVSAAMRAASVASAQERARVALGRGDFAEGARVLAGAASAAGAADHAPELRVAAAIAAWAAGDPAATAALRAVRDDADLANAIRRRARETLDAIETEPGRKPDWLLTDGAWLAKLGDHAAGTPLALIGAALGIPIAPGDSPTASHLRAALAQAHVETVRVIFDDALLARVLAMPDVLVVIEEEQPTCAGFLVVRGIERTGQLVLVMDPAVPGASVRPLAEQWRRTALSGRSGLIVTGTGEAGAARRRALEAAGITDDARLALVDRAHFDPEDPEVPHAHVAQLAAQAIAAAPDIPMAHRRHGEALLALAKLGRLDGDARLLERWVAETRERFPEAEWPLQLYAQALELWNRWPEALVAWCDATRIDEEDHRNLFGQANAARRTGGLAGGRFWLRRALARKPDHATGWVWLAEEALGDGLIDEAAIAVELASELAPEAIEVRVLQATVAEKQGDSAEATRQLAAAVVDDAPEKGQTIRLWRRYLSAGAWDAMHDLARRRILAKHPGSTGAWSVLLDGLIARGDGREALQAMFASLERCNPEGGLIENFVEVLTTFVPSAELPGVLAQLEERLAGQSDPLIQIARGIAFAAGLVEPAAAMLRRLAEQHPQDANAPYSLAQIFMSAGVPAGCEAELDAALARTLALAPNFPWVRYLHGWRQLATAPARTIELVQPVVAAAPSLFWDLMARALDRSGRDADAASLRARLPEVAMGAREHSAFLREKGLSQVLVDLLELAAKDPQARPRVRVDLARAYGRLRRPADAAALLVPEAGETLDPFRGLLLVKQAALAGRGDLVLAHGPATAAAARADSSRYADPWPVDAIVAAAASAAGDAAARAQFVTRAGKHVVAWRQLVRAERALGAPDAAADLVTLAHAAPGSAATIDHPEL